DFLTHPHRKLTAAADDEFGFNPGLRLDERSHTGRAGQVVSNLAVTNADALHKILLHCADAEISAMKAAPRSYASTSQARRAGRSFPFACPVYLMIIIRRRQGTVTSREKREPMKSRSVLALLGLLL